MRLRLSSTPSLRRCLRHCSTNSSVPATPGPPRHVGKSAGFRAAARSPGASGSGVTASRPLPARSAPLRLLGFHCCRRRAKAPPRLSALAPPPSHRRSAPLACSGFTASQAREAAPAPPSALAPPPSHRPEVKRWPPLARVSPLSQPRKGPPPPSAPVSPRAARETAVDGYRLGRVIVPLPSSRASYSCSIGGRQASGRADAVEGQATGFAGAGLHPIDAGRAIRRLCPRPPGQHRPAMLTGTIRRGFVRDSSRHSGSPPLQLMLTPRLPGAVL
jgi:hypothetical protein